MEKQMKFDNLNQDQLNILLNTPHQIYLVDDILKAEISAFKSSITFGNLSPAGTAQTAVSITLSTKDLYDIAHKILAAIDSKKLEITADQNLFLKELK